MISSCRIPFEVNPENRLDMKTFPIPGTDCGAGCFFLLLLLQSLLLDALFSYRPPSAKLALVIEKLIPLFAQKSKCTLTFESRWGWYGGKQSNPMVKSWGADFSLE